MNDRVTISEECRNGLPWELLFADDLAIIADSRGFGGSEQKNRFVCGWIRYDTKTKSRQ